MTSPRSIKAALALGILGHGAAPVHGKADTTSAFATITVPTAAPTNAVEVPPDFVGFGFGQAWSPNYANVFSENLIDSVGARMAAPPVIRMGGTVGDKFLWDPNQVEAVVPIDGQDPTLSSTTFIVGPAYFDSFKYFPNAKISYQATLGNPLNFSSTVPIIQGAYAAIGRDRLAAIAIGNEVESEYKTAAGYTTAALEIQNQVITALNLTGADQKIFEVVDTLSPDGNTHAPYAVEEVFEAGIDDNGLTLVAAEHFYQISGPKTYDPTWLQTRLMNHTSITTRFVGFEESIQYLMKNFPDVKYVLSETGTAIGNPNPPLELSDSFGAALWSVDFNLASMVRHVARVADSGRPKAAHSSWVPDNSSSNVGPTVRPPFAVDPMMADFVGTTPHSVVELSISGDGNRDLMSAYAGYLTKTGDLDRVAIVNFNFWTSTLNTTRPVRTFDLQIGSYADSVTVQRLHADQGANALGYDLDGPDANVTWAGEQWTYDIDNGKGHFPSGGVVEETVAVNGGVASIDVPDSEAVIVWIT